MLSVHVCMKHVHYPTVASPSGLFLDILAGYDLSPYLIMWGYGIECQTKIYIYRLL